MVSSAHEAMHQIFREDPGLFARALPRAGIAFPEPTAIENLDTALTEIRPLERRVDTLQRMETADGERYLLAIESQSEPDPAKLNSWTYYLAHLYAKYKIPPILLVTCRDKTTASWASEPIRIGLPTHTSIAVFPLVLGPDNLPAITDPDEAAQDLPLSVLSTLIHAKDPALPAILDALATALANTGGEVAKGWAEYTEIGLGDPRTRATWRNLMATFVSRFPGSGTFIEETHLKGLAEGLAEGQAEGRAKGRAEDILRILDLRGVDVPEAARERVAGCTDLETLGTWFDRALTAADTEELFGEV
ncbi:hypothetical protein ACOT81_16925 [Streptomyces sp. WI04-05B]|uniref:hypothetical protein n=1 Tax=Streptomyces TaxID=1883 RepID=UPI0029AF82E0|nr:MULTISPECIES: hypothetical protein [unclassified Streptomyces]MDX2543851.1 hypothetical protein [Streptomyces sp. WI04-05B]MDX2582059.1 hypothetical protein [Streptomyces sp. WI04-05A]